MLANGSLSRPAHNCFLVLVATLTLSALAAGSANASVTPDQSFGNNGVVSLQVETPLDLYAWDDGTTLRDGSVAFVAARGYPYAIHRQPVIRIIRADGKIDRNLGPKYRIPYPAWTRAYFVERNAPTVIARQADGKLLLAGGALVPIRKGSQLLYRPGWFVLRLLKSGDRDRSFGRNGVAIVSDRGTPHKRKLFDMTGPKVLRIDRRGGVLLHGVAPAEGSGPVLVRLRPNGDRDRRFRRIDDATLTPQMELTDSGEIVTVTGAYRPITSGPGTYGVDAVIRRYTPSGVRRDEQTAPLPGWGSNAGCNGKCGSSPPLPWVDAKVTPDGGVLIVGGASYAGPYPGAMLTKVDPVGNVDQSFGTHGTFILPEPYERGAILTRSVRPNGEIWAVMSAYLPGAAEAETRLLRLTANGEIIRPADGSIGTPLPKEPHTYVAGRCEFVGSALLESQIDGSALRTMVVRRWNLKF